MIDIRQQRLHGLHSGVSDFYLYLDKIVKMVVRKVGVGSGTR